MVLEWFGQSRRPPTVGAENQASRCRAAGLRVADG